MTKPMTNLERLEAVLHQIEEAKKPHATVIKEYRLKKGEWEKRYAKFFSEVKELEPKVTVTKIEADFKTYNEQRWDELTKLKAVKEGYDALVANLDIQRSILQTKINKEG